MKPTDITTLRRIDNAPGCVQERLDRQNRFGWLGESAKQREPDGHVVRVLWRMKARRVVTAALYSHPAGTELRFYFESEGAGDLLHSQVERFDVSVLEDRAARSRASLLEKGWLEVPSDPSTRQ